MTGFLLLLRNKKYGCCGVELYYGVNQCYGVSPRYVKFVLWPKPNACVQCMGFCINSERGELKLRCHKWKDPYVGKRYSSLLVFRYNQKNPKIFKYIQKYSNISKGIQIYSKISQNTQIYPAKDIWGYSCQQRTQCQLSRQFPLTKMAPHQSLFVRIFIVIIMKS